MGWLMAQIAAASRAPGNTFPHGAGPHAVVLAVAAAVAPWSAPAAALPAAPRFVDALSAHPAPEMAAAVRGDAVAAFNVGLREHRLRPAGATNWSSALPVVEWYGIAARGGHADAIANLGAVMEAGWGCLRDPEGAARNYRLAADLGSPEAAYNLARLASVPGGDEAAAGPAGATIPEGDYLAGWHALRSGVNAEAEARFRRGALRGHALSAYALGHMHASGLAAGASRAEAMQWFARAGQAGSAEAELALGLLLDEGDAETPPDVHAAAEHFRRGAALGSPGAQYAIGICHYFGRGVDRDPRESFRWWTAAARLGNAASGRALAGLQADISPDERDRLRQEGLARAAAPVPVFEWALPRPAIPSASPAMESMPAFVAVSPRHLVAWSASLPPSPATGTAECGLGRVRVVEVHRDTRLGLVLFRADADVPGWTPAAIAPAAPAGGPRHLAAIDTASPRWDGVRFRSGIADAGTPNPLPAGLAGVRLDPAGRVEALVAANGFEDVGPGALRAFLEQSPVGATAWEPAPGRSPREVAGQSLARIELSRNAP